MSEDEAQPKELVRWPTDVPGLDKVLGGGLLKGGLYLLEGAPGSGKTILASQICFSLIKRGEKVVYVTLIAETHGKLIGHLSTMRFFDSRQLGRGFFLLSGYGDLTTGGRSRLFEMLAREVQTHKPYFLVIDGFRAAREIQQVELDLIGFVHRLNTFAMSSGCTMLLLSPYEADETRSEHTLIDGLIELDRRSVGMQMVRELAVHKIRAASQLPGRHAFIITEEGLTVFPRFESLPTLAETTFSPDGSRLKFNVGKLDDMLRGGVLRTSVTTLIGSPGTGKTLLGLHFLVEGARNGEPSLHFGFYEPREALLTKADGVGLPLREAVDSGALEVIWQPALEQIVDQLAYKLMDAVKRRKVRRLLIDGIGGFREATAYPERLVRFLTALMTELRALNVTTVVTEELPLFAPDVQSPLHPLVENIIYLRQVELRSQLYRLISIMKLRDSPYDSAIREFVINDKGIFVESSFESAEAILTGRAQVRSDGPENENKTNRGGARRRRK
ncbi:MAG: RAD55 family ATPase [Sulfurifustaceae bacterium]